MAQAYLDFEKEKETKLIQEQKELNVNQLMEDLLGSQLDQDIFLDNNEKIGKIDIKKINNNKRKYSSTKVKTRNILTNLSYLRVNRLDFDNKSYVLDFVTFIIQYLNVFSLDLKLETELEKNMLMFIWENCLPSKLTEFISSKHHYDTLSAPNSKFKDVYQIIHNYMSYEPNYEEARKLLRSYFDEIRYVFSVLFPKIYTRTNESGQQIKSRFDFSFSLWINNKYVNKKEETGKNINSYNDRANINELEQKPLKNELVDVINVLNEETKNKESVNVTINESNKLKPVNEIKKNFLNEREKRKRAKLMKKKKI